MPLHVDQIPRTHVQESSQALFAFVLYNRETAEDNVNSLGIDTTMVSISLFVPPNGPLLIFLHKLQAFQNATYLFTGKKAQIHRIFFRYALYFAIQKMPFMPMQNKWSSILLAALLEIKIKCVHFASICILVYSRLECNTCKIIGGICLYQNGPTIFTLVLFLESQAFLWATTAEQLFRAMAFCKIPCQRWMKNKS